MRLTTSLLSINQICHRFVWMAKIQKKSCDCFYMECKENIKKKSNMKKPWKPHGVTNKNILREIFANVWYINVCDDHFLWKGLSFRKRNSIYFCTRIFELFLISVIDGQSQIHHFCSIASHLTMKMYLCLKLNRQ